MPDRNENSTDLPFEITNVGYIAHKKGFAVHMHQDEYEFHYLPHAKCTIENNHHQYIIPDHSLIFSEPYIHHGIVYNSNTPLIHWYYYRFRIKKRHPGIIQALRKAFNDRGYVRLGPPFDTRLREMLVRLRSPEPLLYTSGIYMFAAFVYEMAWDGWKHSLISSSTHFNNLIRHMQENVTGKLSLEEYAQEMGINKSHLIRLFKKRTGLSPIKYFNQMKVESASHLLKHSSLTVKELAQQMGFCDEFYFSRIFKQYTGLSPLAFRKETREC